MSFGAGWTAANNWQGDYDKVGNLSAYANYANAHTYPNPGQITGFCHPAAQQRCQARGRQQPRHHHRDRLGQRHVQPSLSRAIRRGQAALDGIKDGDAKMYYYALFDDSSGQFGLMNSGRHTEACWHGTARPDHPSG